MWKVTRIVILLFLLAKAVQITLLEQSNVEWKKGYYVALYPVNADGSQEVNTYIKTLKAEDFSAIPDYFATQATRYSLETKRPIEVILGDVISEIPPAPPKNGSIFEVICWSLKFRFFSWTHAPETSIKPDIRMYLLFHDPETHDILSHSTALSKGMIGRVNLFGHRGYHQQNMVIVAHELLHTVNATDKYRLTDNMPIFPEGYAEPEKLPRYPQKMAELMGGRIPFSETNAEIPETLADTLIGEKTAQEIGWIKIKEK
jgi:hypothetical protein